MAEPERELRLDGRAYRSGQIVRTEWRTRTVMGTWRSHVVAEWAKVLVTGEAGRLELLEVTAPAEVYELKQHWFDVHGGRSDVA